MKVKNRILSLLISVIALCVFGFAVSLSNVNAYATETEIEESNVSVEWLWQKENVSGSRYSGLYQIYIKVGTVLNSTKSGGDYSMIDGINKSVQDYLLINGVSVKEINETFDDSETDYLLFPWNMGGTYAVPVMLFVPCNVNEFYMEVHADYLASLDGKLEVTFKNGFTYTDGTEEGANVVKYNGNDVTYKFMAGKWYKSGTEPTLNASNYTEVISSAAMYEAQSNNDRIAVPFNTVIHGGTMIGDYHITQISTNWTWLQNYVKINGKTVAQINAKYDDSAWDYSSSSWYLSWASSDPVATYCQPVGVQVASSTLYLNLHDNLREDLIGDNDCIVIEILPGFGVIDSSTNEIKLNTEREVSVIMKDVNGTRATAKVTNGNGIDAVNKVLTVDKVGDEYRFDIDLSSNIMLDNHYDGSVTFNYVGNIWKNFVYVVNGDNKTSVSTLNDSVRVEVASATTFADKKKVRFFIKDTLFTTDSTLVLKEGMPFSSGEVLSKDFTVSFETLATSVSGSADAVLGYTYDTLKFKPGTVAGYCLADKETATLTAVTMSAEEFKMIKGASIRLAEGSSGLRFMTRVSDTLTAKLNDFFGEGNFGYSVLIERNDDTSRTVSVETWNGFAIDDEGNDLEGYDSFNVAIISIAESNYDKVYTPTAKLTVTYADGTTLTFNATANDNARSIRAVADVVYANEASSLEDWQLAIIEIYRTKA